MSDLGVDLHTNNFTVCRLLSTGKERLESYGLHELERFRKTLRKRDRVAVEATGNTRYFMEQIQDRLKEVQIVDPGRFEVVKRSVKKTDKNDARNLAVFLSKDMLPQARKKSKPAVQLNSLASTRDKLVKQRTALINKVHNILNSHGIKYKKESLGTKKGLDSIWSYDWDVIVQVELEVLSEQIVSLNASIKKLDIELKDKGKGFKGHKNLTSIKGIGDTSASILLSVIGDVKEFPDSDKLAAYFGIVPRVKDSNEHQRHGRITKRGSKLGRTTLVQCTLIAKMYSPYLRKYYERMKARRGSGKAIVATARKFLKIIYDTLINDWVFADFPNFVLVKT